MITNNAALYGAKIFAEIGRDILFFPIWWYSKGLLLVGKKLVIFISNRQKSLGLLVWIKNIHRPMYQQYDWQGMLISFFMRLVMIFFRSLLMFFWLIIAIIIFIFWLLLPIIVIYEIVSQLNA
ncbi:MAG: hypothetical protein U9R06_01520 [Patescibacteria group bacterium]|nr:hypothetical protein [Patescibacteria group bacterium]